MKLRFLTQEVSNFKAFSGGPHRFVWDAPGVTYICGENRVTRRLGANGVGKSSLFDAFAWSLTGRTPGGLRNPDIMPWAGVGNPRVVQTLEIDDHSHELVRTVSPNRILWDDSEITQAVLAEKIMGFDLLINTVLLAQGRPLFYDLEPLKKMELFSDTLGLDRWETRSDAAKKAADAADAKVEGERRKLDSVVAGAEELERLLVVAKESSQEWTNNWRKAKREAAARRTQLEREYEAADKVVADADLRLDGAETELAALEKQKAELDLEYGPTLQKLIRAESAREAALGNLTEAKAELEGLKQAKVCPTCGQPVKAANLTEHRAHLDKEIADLKVKAEEIDPKLVSSVKLFESRIASNKSYAQSFRAKVESARNDLRRSQPEAARLKAELDAIPKIENEQNPHIAQIRDIEERLASLRKDATVRTAQIDSLVQIAERNRFWVKGFRDIRLRLIEDVLDELELVTATMLEEVALTDWRVRYDIERETKAGTTSRALSVQINAPGSKGFVRWENWSGGEQQRLRLVGARALSDVLLAHAGIQVNLEILDEPASYWSTQGVEELCDYLAEQARATRKSIVLVEHKAIESAHFGRVLRVIRDDKGAFIEEKR